MMFSHYKLIESYYMLYGIVTIFSIFQGLQCNYDHNISNAKLRSSIIYSITAILLFYLNYR